MLTNVHLPLLPFESVSIHLEGHALWLQDM